MALLQIVLQSSGIGCNNTPTSCSLITSPTAIRFDPHDTVIRYQVRTNVSRMGIVVDYYRKLTLDITPYLSWSSLSISDRINLCSPVCMLL